MADKCVSTSTVSSTPPEPLAGSSPGSQCLAQGQHLFPLGVKAFVTRARERKHMATANVFIIIGMEGLAFQTLLQKECPPPPAEMSPQV